MRFSRFWVLAILLLSVSFGSSCGWYNRVMARKDLVDGSKAYKDRKFKDAEQLFRNAVARDPNGEYVEGQVAQLFLARTLHSEYIGDRANKAKAEEAIREYQKVLKQNPKDQSSYKAIASLYENLQMTDDWLKWVTDRSQNASLAPEQRAEAFTSLAAKKNSCANDITDTEQTKKKVTKDGKPAYQYVKPANAADYDNLKKCIDEGTQLIDQAIGLETDQVRNAPSLTPKTMTDEQLKSNLDFLKVFESARSYKTSLLFQASFLAEMDGRTADHDNLKKQGDEAKAKFLELSDMVKKIQAEIDERVAAAEAEKSANANANSANSAK